ncbi:MAG: nucleoside recognition protein [Bacteroidaceae bacterium]|nr:nucleoside recognition protein [Bacteroidaceae bacterium]
MQVSSDLLDKFMQSLRSALPGTWKSASWLLKLMIPISLTVALLQHWGILAWIAGYLNPLFSMMGLPGESAVLFISGAAAGTYAGVAAMMSVHLTLRQATIVGIMILLCHALPMECTVNHKTGSNFWKMGLIRILMAFVAAMCLNLVLPEMSTPYLYIGAAAESSLAEVLLTWAVSQIKISIMVFLIIYSLMVLQCLIEAYSLLAPLSRFLAPLMRLLGLPRNAAYMWLVGNVLGLSYGSAVMLDLEEKGQITRADANAVNYHLIMNHSMLEDTIVLAMTGVSALWILGTRMFFALVVVWGRKAIKSPLRLPLWVREVKS